MADDRNDDAGLLDDLRDAGTALGRLAETPEAFQEALDSFRAGKPDAFRDVLGRLDLLPGCRLVCDWVCSKECVLRCFLLAGRPPKSVAEIASAGEFADVTARLTADDGTLRRLVEAVERQDPDAWGGLIRELELERFSHLLCHWVCFVRCGLVCDWVCARGERPVDLFAGLRSAGEAVAELAAQPEALSAAVDAVLSGDCRALQRVVASAGLSTRCSYICFWLCSWRCVLLCITLVRSFLDDVADPSDEEILAFARVTGGLAERPDVLKRLVATVARADEQRFREVIDELQLRPYAVQLCHWLCYLRCRRFCICVCPPLIARIDTPAEGACAETAPVPACTSSGGVPLVGIEITGSAGGAGFDHYTLRYSWGGNPPVDTAVVYPDCSRPPAATGSSVAVVGGTLGWLDVTLLPPGITAVTVYLDVFDGGAGHVSDTATFGVKTTAVEISAVANVAALEGPDPFHVPNVIRLVKSVNDPSPLVPEQSIGGSVSIDGSAYVIGCDRIMTQFVLARFPAPPAVPAPNPADASGGTPIMAPVVYEDIVDHPWQSGCFPFITPNTILNGNLFALWSTNPCIFPFPHTVPKVKGQQWPTNPNGRFLLLLEVRDRPLPGGAFPGSFAAKSQVVVWIDNDQPTALITSIGGITGCGDLKLSDYKGTTAEVRGVAWDPPIDPSAPQQKPNDNFGSYDLEFKKDGEVTTITIPAATPNTRVPNLWPGPVPAGADGVLANWDIGAAIDHNAPGPPPEGKLARGERCAYVISLTATDTTHVGDSGNHHSAGPFNYAINVINDL